MANRSWLGFPVRVSTPGVFKIMLSVSAATGAQSEVLVDGNSLGTVTLPPTGSAPALTTTNLSAGSHGIVVRNISGSFQLNQVVVQAGP